MTPKETKVLIETLVNELNDKFPTNKERRYTFLVTEFKRRTNYKYTTDEVIDIINSNDYFKGTEVTLDFISKGKNRVLASASRSYNIIQITPRLLNKQVEFTSGYDKENKFLTKYVTDKATFVKWVICHEYCHLLYPELGHTNEFFSKVEELYIKITNNNN